MTDINLSSIVGGYYDAVAAQMVLDQISTASTEGAWKMADRRNVFDALVFNLEGVELAKKTTTLAFDDATDSTTFASNEALRDYTNASAYLTAQGLASAELSKHFISSGIDASTASYASKSFSVAGEEGTPQGVALSRDGTTMYVVGSANATVYQYTLSTPFDVSTASYASKSFSVAGEEADPRCIVFSEDGTTMYTVGINNNTVYQYTLSTPFDVSTASYASKSFSVTGEGETLAQGIALSRDGTAMYVVGNTNDTIYQYTLSTPFDVSTASYASKSFGVGGEEPSPTDLALSEDGTAMYVVGNTNDTVYQYTLSTPFDASTASYASKSFSVTGEETVPRGLALGSDGENMYALGSTNDTIYQYTGTSEGSVLVAP